MQGQATFPRHSFINSYGTGGSIPPLAPNKTTRKRGEEMNFKQIKAIEKANKQRLLKVMPTLTEDSGIYILTREENGFKFAYIGQAKHLLTRLAQHLSGYQHIDLSLKKHGLKSEENPNGWDITAITFDEAELDKAEQDFIKHYANAGYQLRNKTAGGQGAGKFEIAETKPRKTYHDGIKQGYEKARKEVAKLFEKNLVFSINGKENKLKAKAYEKFAQFIGEQND
jgi:predicted GIY-YIG superfamily endonuclease